MLKKWSNKLISYYFKFGIFLIIIGLIPTIYNWKNFGGASQKDNYVSKCGNDNKFISIHIGNNIINAPRTEALKVFLNTSRTIENLHLWCSRKEIKSRKGIDSNHYQHVKKIQINNVKIIKMDNRFQQVNEIQLRNYNIKHPNDPRTFRKYIRLKPDITSEGILKYNEDNVETYVLDNPESPHEPYVAKCYGQKGVPLDYSSHCNTHYLLTNDLGVYFSFPRKIFLENNFIPFNQKMREKINSMIVNNRNVQKN